MTVNTQKPIVIFRGDNTAAFDLRTIRILLTGDLDLTNATARFDLLDFTKSWTTEEVATGELSIVFDSAQTKSFALGPQTGTLRLYDMSTGTPRQLTIVNKIPFFVTNRVCEIDSQSYEADVCVSGGNVIHIEFKVGAGAVEGKADKVKNATAGDLASLTADGNLEDSGIPKTDVLRKSQMDATPTAGSQNPVTSDGIKQAIDAATPSDYAQVKAQVQQNTSDISTINGKIPAQASAQNQLADKAFVNSSIATNTATFRGSYNLVSDLGLTVSATEQQVAAAIATKLASLVPPVVPENNDYVFVQVPKTDADPTVIDRVDRYKCTVTESGGVTTRVWEYEWSLNNSSFTADQWAAINSGITSGAVEKLAGIEAGAQVNTIQTVKVNGTALTPENKAVNVTVPIPATLDLPVIAGTASVGQSDKFAREDHVHPAETEVVEYRLPDDCFPVKYLPQEGDDHPITISDNDGLLFQDAAAGIEMYAYDVSSPGGYGVLLAHFDTTTRKYSSLGYVYSLTFTKGGVDTAPTANTWPVLEKNAVFVRNTQVVKSVNGKTDAVELDASDVGAVPTTGGTMTGNLFIDGMTAQVAVGYTSPNYTNLRVFTLDGVLRVATGSLLTVRWPESSGDFALLQNLAANYSTSATYAIDQLCVYLGKLYRCTTAITTAEDWTAAHWTEATVEDVLAAIRSALNNKAPLASPAFTGTPTAPDIGANTSSQVATKTYVDAQVGSIQTFQHDAGGYYIEVEAS